MITVGCGGGGGAVNGSYDNTDSVLTVFGGQTLPTSAPAERDSITGFSGGGSATAQFGSNTTPIGKLTCTVTSAFTPNVQHN